MFVGNDIRFQGVSTLPIEPMGDLSFDGVIIKSELICPVEGDCSWDQIYLEPHAVILINNSGFRTMFTHFGEGGGGISEEHLI